MKRFAGIHLILAAILVYGAIACKARRKGRSVAKEVVFDATDTNNLTNDQILGNGFDLLTQKAKSFKCIVPGNTVAAVQGAAPATNTQQPQGGTGNDPSGAQVAPPKSQLFPESSGASLQLADSSTAGTDDGGGPNLSDIALPGPLADIREERVLESEAPSEIAEQIASNYSRQASQQGSFALADANGCNSADGCISIFFAENALQLRAGLSMGFNAGAKLYGANLGGGAEASLSTSYKKNSTYLVIYGRRIMMRANIEDPTIKPENLSLILRNNTAVLADVGGASESDRQTVKSSFQKLCGNSYVKTIIRGREFQLVYEFTNVSAEAAAALRSNFSVSVPRLAKGEAKFSQEVNDALSKVSGKLHQTWIASSMVAIPPLSDQVSVQQALETARSFLNHMAVNGTILYGDQAKYADPNNERILAAIVEPYYDESSGQTVVVPDFMGPNGPIRRQIIDKPLADRMLPDPVSGIRLVEAQTAAYLASMRASEMWHNYFWHQWTGNVRERFETLKGYSSRLTQQIAACTANPNQDMCVAPIAPVPVTKDLPAPDGRSFWVPTGGIGPERALSACGKNSHLVPRDRVQNVIAAAWNMYRWFGDLSPYATQSIPRLAQLNRGSIIWTFDRATNSPRAIAWPASITGLDRNSVPDLMVRDVAAQPQGTVVCETQK